MKIWRIVALLWVGVFLSTAMLPSTSAKYYHSETRECTIVWSDPVKGLLTDPVNGVASYTVGSMNAGYYAIACYGAGGGNDYGNYGGRGGRVRAIVQLSAGTTLYFTEGTPGGLYTGGSTGGTRTGGNGFPATDNWGGNGGGGYSRIMTVAGAPTGGSPAGIIALAGGGGGGARPRNNGSNNADNGSGTSCCWGGRGGDSTAGSGGEYLGNSSSDVQNGMASDVGPSTGTTAGSDYPSNAQANHARWGRAAGGGRNHYAPNGAVSATLFTTNGGGRINRSTTMGASGTGSALQGGNVSSNGGTLNANFAGGGGGGYRGGGAGGFQTPTGSNPYHPGGGGGGSSYLGNVTIAAVVEGESNFASVLAPQLGAWVDGHTTPPGSGQNGKTVLIYLGPDNPVGKADGDYLYNW